MLKKFIKNFSYLAVIQISNTLLPLVVMPYLSRLISPEMFGEIEFTRVFCYYFSIVILFGFDFTGTREISLNRENKDKINDIISQTTYAKLILFLISTVVFIAIILSSPSLNIIFWPLVTTYIINIGYAFYPVWFFQGIENLKLISTISLIIRFGIIIMTFVFLRDEKDFWLFNFFQGIAMIIISIISFIILRKNYSFKLHFFNLLKIKRIFIQSAPLFFSIVLVTIMTSSYFIFLKIFSSSPEMAKFSVTNKIIATAQGLILLPFTQAFFPIITKQAETSFITFRKNIKIAAYVLFLITFILGLLLFFFGDLVITIIFGKQYLISFQSLKIMAFLPMFAALTNVFAYQGLLSLKKDKLFLFIHLIYTVFSILLNFLILNNYSAEYAAYIRIIVEMLLFFTTFVAYKSIIKKERKLSP